MGHIDLHGLQASAANAVFSGASQKFVRENPKNSGSSSYSCRNRSWFYTSRRCFRCKRFWTGFNKARKGDFAGMAVEGAVDAAGGKIIGAISPFSENILKEC